MIPLLCALWVAVLLGGCSKTRNLEGKWVFDRAYTEEHFPKDPANPSESPTGMDGLKPALATLLVPMMVAQLDGATLTVDSKKMIFVTKDGNGQVNDYEVLEQPDDHTWRVKGTDGKLETYVRDGDRLGMVTTGDVQAKMYFKRADK